MAEVRHRRVASSERQSEASDSGHSTPRSSRASEVDPARKLAHTVFTLFCATVFTVVYFAELPLRLPYWLMLVQMLIELVAQPDLDRIMQVHHVANLGVTVLYLYHPTFDPIIREGLAVEIATLLLTINTLAGRRSNALLKLSFALCFLYTRFYIGGIRLSDPDFVWSNAGAMPPNLIRFGWSCLLVIHGCAIVWGGQVALQFVRAFRSDSFRTKSEPLSAMPLGLVCLCRGSVPVAAIGCGLAGATFLARRGRRFGRPRQDGEGRPVLLPRFWRAIEVCLSVGLSLAILAESNHAAGPGGGRVDGGVGGAGVATVGWPALLCAHAAAAACILGADVLLHPNLQLSGAVEWCVCVAVAAGDALLVEGRSRVDSITLATMLALCGSILYQLRRQHALEYAPTLMHVMAAVLAFQGCHCIRNPTLMQRLAAA